MSLYTRWKNRRAHSLITRDKPLEVLEHRLPFKAEFDGHPDDKLKCACHLMYLIPGEQLTFWPYRKWGGHVGHYYLHQGIAKDVDA